MATPVKEEVKAEVEEMEFEPASAAAEAAYHVSNAYIFTPCPHTFYKKYMSFKIKYSDYSRKKAIG